MSQPLKDRIADLEGQLIALQAAVEEARQKALLQLTKDKDQIQSLKIENEQLKARLRP